MALEEGTTITTEMRSTVLGVFYIRALLYHWQIYYFWLAAMSALTSLDFVFFRY